MKRFRQYRTDQPTRDSYADISLSAEDFIYPYFIIDGEGRTEPIGSMPGVYRFTIDKLLDDLCLAVASGIGKILLFGVIEEQLKDERGAAGLSPDSLICRAVSAIKEKYPALYVITDVCLCEYTSHGHCGLLHNHDVENDTTLPLLAEMAFRHAVAGADCVAPSSMMDGQVESIRKRLVAENLDTHILAYSAKYASSFYGPFRDAAGSAPAFGDRKTYQMDYRTRDQALEEIAADISEGADSVMVKPALSYLDVISRASATFPDIPLVAYQVSGEYSMLKEGAAKGLFDEYRIFHETLTAIKRAGAGQIITYYARDFLANTI